MLECSTGLLCQIRACIAYLNFCACLGPFLEVVKRATAPCPVFLLSSSKLVLADPLDAHQFCLEDYSQYTLAAASSKPVQYQNVRT